MEISRFDFRGLRALVRVDFNVPINAEGVITDDTRMKAALPTLKQIISQGGVAIVVSHLGRPKGIEEKNTLRQLIPHLEKLMGCSVAFCSASVGEEARCALKEIPMGSIVLLENIRFYEEEEGKLRQSEGLDAEALKQAKSELKARQKVFAQELSTLADVYVNDAFGTAHRAHASTALVAQYFSADKKMFGYLMQKEVAAVDSVLLHARKPFTAIIGGAKVSSKIDIIENLLNRVDNLVIVGGMAYTFAKAQGGSIGKSLFEEDKVSVAAEVLEKAQAKGVRLLLPVDTVATQAFSNDAPARVFPTNAIEDGWMGMDIATEAAADMSRVLLESQTILWNGPAGVFEFDNFAKGSEAIAQAVAQATQKGAYSLVGGGDSVACINKLGLEEQISYVSTGGGALLEAIEGKVLPGVAAIKE